MIRRRRTSVTGASIAAMMAVAATARREPQRHVEDRRPDALERAKRDLQTAATRDSETLRRAELKRARRRMRPGGASS